MTSVCSRFALNCLIGDIEVCWDGLNTRGLLALVLVTGIRLNFGIIRKINDYNYFLFVEFKVITHNDQIKFK